MAFPRHSRILNLDADDVRALRDPELLAAVLGDVIEHIHDQFREEEQSTQDMRNDLQERIGRLWMGV